MPVLMHARLPGMTADQYDAIIAHVQENLDGETPGGAHFHVAGPVEEDWQVVEVWDSEGDHAAYVEGYIYPASEELGIAIQPVVQYWDLHSEIDLS